MWSVWVYFSLIMPVAYVTKKSCTICFNVQFLQARFLKDKSKEKKSKQYLQTFTYINLLRSLKLTNCLVLSFKLKKSTIKFHFCLHPMNEFFYSFP